MKLLYTFILGASISAFGQNNSSSKWQDVFSYNNVIQIREDENTLLIASENGIFKYNRSTGEVSKYLSKINGLHNINIRAFDYNPATQVGLIGYTDGSLDVITKDKITYIVDAPINTTYVGSKKINHIHIKDSQAVISTDYGVSIFNLDKKEYSETAFFPTPAKEAVIKDNKVYAIIGNELKSFDLANINNFNIKNLWSKIANGEFHHIAANDQILAYSDNNQLNINGTIVSLQGIKDININEEVVIAVQEKSVNIYDANATPKNSQTSDVLLNTGWISKGNLFGGSRYEGLSDFKNFYLPDGPYANRAYKINIHNNKIWVATGTLDGDYNWIHEDFPTNGTKLPSLGFYFYNGSEWIYPSYFKSNEAQSTHFNIIDIVGSPFDTRETYFANYSVLPRQGFYKFIYNDASKDFTLKKYYAEEQNDRYFNRTSGLTFDDKGNLFGVSSYYVENNKEHGKYGVYSKDNDKFIYRNITERDLGGFIEKPIYHDGLIISPITRRALVAIIDTRKSPTQPNDDKIYFIDDANNGLLIGDDGKGVLSLAIDKNNQIWIGQRFGLGTISLPQDLEQLKNTKVEPIIIEQNGIGEELFRDNRILDIEVDSSNNKWISVDGGGVFYLSPNGQQTFAHFTSKNSPLPNNQVTDISIDNLTGKVYFATQNGIVAYQSDVKNTSENFGEVLVYPNPVVYSQYQGNVRIKGLAEKTFIRITDTAGNVVHQAEARGGWYDWDLSYKGKRVASGIYFVLMTNANGTDKATAKIAVVN